MSLKLIFVAGVASGGTSAIAGVLHYLGVDMGVVTKNLNPRPFRTFEDITSFEKVTNGLWEHENGVLLPQLTGTETARRFRVYLKRRFDKATRRPGVKNIGLQWIATAEDISNIPIEVVSIVRNPTDTMNSLARHNANTRSVTDVICGCHRMLMNVFVERFRPKIVIDYEKMLENPSDTVDQVIRAFRLPSTPQQVQKAISSVRRQ